MDFSQVLAAVGSFLERDDCRWAVIGGLGLAAYGLPRTTLDLDLVVDGDCQESLIRWLGEQGYETLHRSAGYSNHLHPEGSWGRVDVVYVRGRTRERLFAAVRQVPGPRGSEIPVPKPEHLAAMKVLAMKNRPERTFQDLADIRFLLTLPGVDREEVREQFARHGLEERYRELEATL